MSTQSITNAIRSPSILKPFAHRNRSTGIAGRRAIECIAMSMIGDGILGFVEPERHVQLWYAGPRWWQKMVQPFVERPTLTRWVGAAEIACGFWLASEQKP
ncbi:MAG TPA: hypothetical protein VFW73_01425 [Lacipirellulaceae bacterium]|nr:hypothetical protein [Lacipirellulaceae bacterium]